MLIVTTSSRSAVQNVAIQNHRLFWYLRPYRPVRTRTKTEPITYGFQNAVLAAQLAPLNIAVGTIHKIYSSPLPSIWIHHPLTCVAGKTRQQITQKSFRVFRNCTGNIETAINRPRSLTSAMDRLISGPLAHAQHAPPDAPFYGVYVIPPTKVELNVTHVSECRLPWLDVYTSMYRTDIRSSLL